MIEEDYQMKDRIRAVIRDRRNNLSEEVRDMCAGVLSDNLEEYIVDEMGLDLSRIKVASYMPVYGEISSLPFCRKVLDKGGCVMMPRVDGRDVRYYKIKSFDKGFVIGSFGIKEPDISLEEADVRDADVIIVPGIAYNDEGIRLGQGGGYFDRLWEHLGGDSPDRKSVIIGVCYDFQIMSSIPVDEKDMTVDVLFEVAAEEEES